jgi:hypothetical protein
MGQSVPPNAAARAMLRRRTRVLPVPQVAEQADHAPNAVTSQSTGQAMVPHARVMARPGHARPPSPAAASTDRFLAWVPPPHDALHRVQ